MNPAPTEAAANDSPSVATNTMDISDDGGGGNPTTRTKSSAKQPQTDPPLPDDDHRFALELEFVQALASPAYWHFLSTHRDTASSGTTASAEENLLLFQDPSFVRFLRYLFNTWSQPAYARFLHYPHALYWLELFLEHHQGATGDAGDGSNNDNAQAAPTKSTTPLTTIAKEWSLPAFRDFGHQQQFMAWQHRHATLYGKGTKEQQEPASNEDAEAEAPPGGVQPPPS